MSSYFEEGIIYKKSNRKWWQFWKPRQIVDYKFTRIDNVIKKEYSSGVTEVGYFFEDSY